MWVIAWFLVFNRSVGIIYFLLPKQEVCMGDHYMAK